MMPKSLRWWILCDHTSILGNKAFQILLQKTEHFYWVLYRGGGIHLFWDTICGLVISTSWRNKLRSTWQQAKWASCIYINRLWRSSWGGVQDQQAVSQSQPEEDLHGPWTCRSISIDFGYGLRKSTWNWWEHIQSTLRNATASSLPTNIISNK